MMVGKRFYSEADMMRMQRDAEARVREMQERARVTAQHTEEGGPPMPPFATGNRNWSTGTNRNRQNRPQRNGGGGSSNNRQGQAAPPRAEPQAEENPPPSQQGAPSAPEEAGNSTILDDIVSSLGLESDTLLIIGLILILVNQKADTTLILALVYLLF